MVGRNVKLQQQPARGICCTRTDRGVQLLQLAIGPRTAGLTQHKEDTYIPVMV